MRPEAGVAGPARPARGFTLVELLIVVIVLGLIVGLMTPRYIAQFHRSKASIARSQFDSLRRGLESYRFDIGSYPTTEQGLDALLTRPEGVDRWQGPYVVDSSPQDPWGNAYHYKSPGEHGPYDLYSLGADGKTGGSGDDADITSWENGPGAGGRNP